MRLCHHCHSKTKKGGGKRKEKAEGYYRHALPQAYPHQYCGRINRICRVMIIISTKSEKNILLLLSLSAKQKNQAFNENVGLKYCALQILWRTAFLCSLTLLVFWGKVEAKAVKRCCISIIPQQEGENLFPELFRGLMECTITKHRGWGWAALLWRLSSEFFSLKTPSSLLTGLLTQPKIFLYYIKIPAKSLDSAAMTKTDSKSVSVGQAESASCGFSQRNNSCGSTALLTN